MAIQIISSDFVSKLIEHASLIQRVLSKQKYNGVLVIPIDTLEKYLAFKIDNQYRYTGGIALCETIKEAREFYLPQWTSEEEKVFFDRMKIDNE